MSEQTQQFILALALSAPLVIAAFRSWNVAQKVRAKASIKPRIAFLTRVSRVIDAIVTVLVVLSVLGITSAFFTVTGIRLLPPPWPLLLFYGAVLVLALAVHFLGRWIEAGADGAAPVPPAGVEP